VDNRKLLNALLLASLVFSFAFMLSSFFVADVPNAGFNAVLSGFLMLTYCVGGFYVLNKYPQSLSVGFLIGVSTMMVFVSFMNAVFWGQQSRSEYVIDSGRDGIAVSPYNKSAMGSVCAFSVLFFLLQLLFVGILIQNKEEFCDGTTVYDDIGPHNAPPGGGMGHESFAYGEAGGKSSSTSYQGGQQGTADL